ncbi:ATP-binding cassette domain-containing protein [Arsenicicoccus sp. MKL-02]|uniref:ATP-binding cassette domain-containing protein n=1 Tax=Arsenicicoccus cauae TaxID=2663847 RepID=A0A6I3IEZ6_9MICO|nr:ATP-binding cassette domain-containing protein [Arsenicicoccus cauae]MTB72818.1 ATP-binding cassette domain-containing protein [Arsenicicoccus cauae]
MIQVEGWTVTYDGAARPALQDADLHVDEGELVLVVGETGSGKSTLLRSLDGLVPHFSGGAVSGRVQVAGRDTRTHRPRDLADVVAMVVQDPAASFVTDTVEDELAYGMEAIGLSPTAMRRRVEETLDLLGLADLRDRGLRSLSGGQQQRVAIGAVLAAGPRILVLDEPTSALDPVAAEDVLSSITRLVHDVGMTVVVAEHRLERVVHHADGIVLLQGATCSDVLPPAAAMARSTVHPPVVGLGRALGWSPLPLSVRDARRAVRPLRDRLAAAPPVAARPVTARRAGTGRREPGAPCVAVDGLAVVRDGQPVLGGVDLDARAGQVVALMGRNGVGKSTLLRVLTGTLRPSRGQVRVDGVDPGSTRARELVCHVGLVPQDAGSLLHADTVARECHAADDDFGVVVGTCRALLSRLLGPTGPADLDGRHPRDLSEGQRLLLALAVVLTGAPRVVLLDEPTRGLDYTAKARLVDVLDQLAAEGRAVVLATHDVELAADVADRVVLLAEGEVVADGPADEVLSASTAFAPQVAKVLHPLPVLTVPAATDLVTRAGVVRGRP